MNKFIPVCEPYLAGNELEYVTDAISTGWISSSGTYVNRFEEEDVYKRQLFLWVIAAVSTSSMHNGG